MQTNSYNKKRKYTPKKKVYRKKRNTNTTTYANKMIKKLLKNQELKVVDNEDSMSITQWQGTGPRQWLLNGVKNGTAYYNRIGHKFTMKSLHLRLFLFPTPTVIDTEEDAIRIMLVYDSRPGGALPGKTDILQDVDKDGTLSTDTMSFPNANNKSRFKIIRDWVKYTPIIVTAVNSTGQAPYMVGGGSSKDQQVYVIDEYIKLKDLETVWLGNKDIANTGTVNEITKGGLYLCVGKDKQDNIQSWYVEWNSRLIFNDN